MIFDDDFSKICDEETHFVQLCYGHGTWERLRQRNEACPNLCTRHSCKLVRKHRDEILQENNKLKAEIEGLKEKAEKK